MKKKITVLFNNTVKRTGCGDELIIPFSQLVTWIKTKELLKHMFKYREARFVAYRFDSIPWPFINALILRFLSSGRSCFEDDRGEVTKVTVPLLMRLGYQALKDFINRKKLLRDTEKMVDSLSENNGVIPKLDLSKNAIYLRTDMWFGVTAGGSVGHIAGVLNQLEHFTGQPTFFTTDYIPTVKDHITNHIITPDKGFRDFRELSSIYFNSYFVDQVSKHASTESLSFVYQRYSLNNYSGVILAKKYGVPLVIEYNGSEVWISRNWGGKPLKYECLSQKIEDLNLLYATVIVVVSKPMKDELVKRGFDPDKILVNPNGVDPEKYSPEISGELIRKRLNYRDRVVLGFIGTFGLWHGAEVLAEAFGRMIRTYPEYRDKVRLMLIGDGITMKKVKETLEEYGVYEETTLTGIVPQREGPEYLAACDVLVSPHVPNPDGTPFFGSPTKLFEYMAMGKGIVASDLDQIGEILEHGQTAWMVKPGDVNALSEGLKRLIDDRELRIMLGSRARKEVLNKYTWLNHTRKIVEHLKALTDNRGGTV